MKLVAEFAADFPAALLVVQHMPGSFYLRSLPSSLRQSRRSR